MSAVPAPRASDAPDAPDAPAAPPPARPLPVRCGADALRVLFLAIAQPLEAETLAFVLDEGGHGGVVTVFSGTHSADSVLAITECLSLAAAAEPRVSSLVVASVRPHGCVLPGDIDRWLEASDIARSHGITLVEWYVITPTGAQCPRDLLGEPERWPAAAR